MKLNISKFDPLGCDFEMPLHAVYYPLGFPLEVTTNSEEILVAAEENWGHCQKLFHVPPLHLRVGVEEGGSGPCPPQGRNREHRNLLMRADEGGNFSVSDLGRGFAVAWLTESVMKYRPYVRLHFLESMACELLWAFHVTPVHAGGVKLGDRGILLCGDAGAGKSTLSYACARRGWTFLSDDTCNLVRGQQECVVIGHPYRMRFREPATELFPELKPLPRTFHNGDIVLEVATADFPEITTTQSCSIDYILLLSRGVPGPPSVAPFPKDTAMRWFEQVICSGSPKIRDEHRASLRNLLKAEILEFRYSDLPSAIALLEDLARDGARPEPASLEPLRASENA